MGKFEAKERAKVLLNGKLSHIKSMIDRGSSYETVDFNLTELQIQADFALSLDLITDDEHQSIKEKWYDVRELLKNLYEVE
ncbi:hypothetical protein [Acinetobacter cumulans]|uniref:hypothetical protein n=1 Tax=Acinetobacter cumulans TaxID=2136182 RepID=UPI0014441E65|nr:hypothetical protein [Acinetobacter cumulans]